MNNISRSDNTTSYRKVLILRFLSLTASVLFIWQTFAYLDNQNLIQFTIIVTQLLILTTISVSGYEVFLLRVFNSGKMTNKDKYSWPPVFWVMQLLCIGSFILLNYDNHVTIVIIVFVYILEVLLLLVSSSYRARNRTDVDLFNQIKKITFDVFFVFLYFLYFSEINMQIILIIMILSRLIIISFLRKDVVMIIALIKVRGVGFNKNFELSYFLSSLKISISFFLIAVSSRMDLIVIPLFGEGLDGYSYAVALRAIGVVQQLTGSIFHKSVPDLIYYFNKNKRFEYSKLKKHTIQYSSITAFVISSIFLVIVQIPIIADIMSIDYQRLNMLFISFALFLIVLDLSIGPVFILRNSLRFPPSLTSLLIWCITAFTLSLFFIGDFGHMVLLIVLLVALTAKGLFSRKFI